MEAQQIETNNEEVGGGCSTGGGKTSFLCRQSSTRWSPTTDQIRILKELYYNNGVRSPTAEQIQRISAKLRQYGKIEGKNVFYWFQNHKARERQKKRFTAAADHFNISMHTTTSGANWKNDDSHLYSNLSSSSSSSAGLLSVGAVGNYGYGSVAMEKSFRECSITQNGNGNGNGSMGQNFTWVGISEHPYSIAYHPFLHDQQKKINSTVNNYQTLEEEDDEDIETLPLFPMHGDDDVKQLLDRHSLITATATTAHTSLELTLNSYATKTSPCRSYTYAP